MLRKTKSPMVLVAIIGAVGFTIWLLYGLLFSGKGADSDLVLFTVQRGELPIVITERGNLESQQATKIRNQVENFSSSRSGQAGTQIIAIVPNGSAVTEGELLVELDSTPVRELLDQQTISYERAVAAQIQEDAKFTNQKKQNETNLANAKLDLDLAELELEMFVDPESGTKRLNEDTIHREIDQINSSILESRAALELRKKEYLGIQELFQLGYKGESDLEQSRLSFLQSEGNLANLQAQLETQQASLRKLTRYEQAMSELSLQGAVENAQRAMEQVEVDNKSLLTQAEAALDAANRTLAKEQERLEMLQQQLEFCKIYAPHDGMVVYERDRDFTVEEGAVVRQRQELLSLPNLSLMQVRTYIHESVLDQVNEGQPVTVYVDAFPDRVYDGEVVSVGVVPAYTGRWGSDVKTYETVIQLSGTVEQLKPGMTAVAEINVDRLSDVLSIPVQAVMQEKADTWCYVNTNGRVESREITLGRSNDKYVHVVEGLNEGDVVVLNPMAVIDQETDSDGLGDDAMGGPAEESSDSSKEVVKGNKPSPKPADSSTKPVNGVIGIGTKE